MQGIFCLRFISTTLIVACNELVCQLLQLQAAQTSPSHSWSCPCRGREDSLISHGAHQPSHNPPSHSPAPAPPASPPEPSPSSPASSPGPSAACSCPSVVCRRDTWAAVKRGVLASPYFPHPKGRSLLLLLHHRLQPGRASFVVRLSPVVVPSRAIWLLVSLVRIGRRRRFVSYRRI